MSDNRTRIFESALNGVRYPANGGKPLSFTDYRKMTPKQRRELEFKAYK